jgi:putative DNA primase/helicase
MTVLPQLEWAVEAFVMNALIDPARFKGKIPEGLNDDVLAELTGFHKTLAKVARQDAESPDTGGTLNVDRMKRIAGNGRGADGDPDFGRRLDAMRYDYEAGAEDAQILIDELVDTAKQAKAVRSDREEWEERAAIIEADQIPAPAEPDQVVPTVEEIPLAQEGAVAAVIEAPEVVVESKGALAVATSAEPTHGAPKPKSATKKKSAKAAKAAVALAVPDVPKPVASPVVEQAVVNIISRAVMGEDVREELKMIPSEMLRGLTKNTKIMLGLTKKLYDEDETGVIDPDRLKSLAEEAGADLAPFFAATVGQYAKDQLIAAITEHFKGKLQKPMALAEGFLEAQGWIGRIRYFAADFYIYRDGRYVQVDEMMVKSQLTAFLHFDQGVKTSRTTINDVLTNIQCLAYTEAPPSSEPGFIPLLNGVLDVDAFLNEREPVLLPHSPDRFITHLLPARFDPEADSVEARAVRQQLLPDAKTLEVLQEVFGYCLVPGNEYKVIVILYGETDTGKSVICSMLTAMLGENSTSCVSLSSMCSDNKFGLLPMVGKLVNITEETGITDKVAEDVIKKISSGSPVDVHRKNKGQLHWRPTTKLVFASNTLPRISDHSDASHNRILLFPFKVRIPKSEQTVGMNDPQFWKDQADGLLQWALMGLVKLRGRGRFQPAPEMVAEVQEYQRASQPIREFLTDTLVADPAGSVCSTALHNKYISTWEEKRGKPLGFELFATEVKRVFPKAIKDKDATSTSSGPTTGRRTRKWRGIRFKEEWDR